MHRIVFVVCQISAPEVCETQELHFEARLPIACIYAAGPELAAVEAAGWRVASWRCADPGADVMLAQEDE